MKVVARVLAIAGLALAAALFARENIGRIADLVFTAIPGLALAAAFHVVPMVVNAFAWQRLFAARQRPALRTIVQAVWIRESINGVLPVARVGGEVAAYRILRRHVASRAEVAASIAADVALSVLSQSAFALLGLCTLLAIGRSTAITGMLLAVAGGMLVLGAAFVLVQRAGALASAARLAERVFAGKLRTIRAGSLRLDRALRAMHARHADVSACAALQFAAWVASAGETWLALHFLGAGRSFGEAVVIESLVQAINSAAFVVPGAIGVQEGAFVLIGSMVGLDAPTSLALAAARRLRDVVIYIPGLVAWHHAEARSATRRRLA
ncbi:MAG: lysylphosphatidylglycerol synthase domain-containing protein [Burkholderiales bacterium]|jgi:putative membrane protein